jgi:hypothetical protein
MAISVDTKELYDYNDFMFILSLFLTILFAAFMQWVHQSFFITHLLLGLSCCFFMYSIYLIVIMIVNTYSTISHIPNLSNLNSARALFKSEVLARKRLLLTCLLCLLPIFPLIYFLTVFHMISNNHSIISYVIAGAFNKIIFASICTDARLEVTHPTIYFLDSQEKLAFEKRSFLRYIFHEIRV